MNDLATLQSLKNRVSDTVRGQFGMLIPEDEFNRLVDAEITAFFDPKAEWSIAKEEVNSGSWHKQYEYKLTTRISPFRMMVWEALRAVCGEKLKEALNTERLEVVIQSSFDANGFEIREAKMGDLIAKMIERMAPELVRHMFSGVILDAVTRAKQEINDSLPDRY